MEQYKFPQTDPNDTIIIHDLITTPNISTISTDPNYSYVTDYMQSDQNSSLDSQFVTSGQSGLYPNPILSLNNRTHNETSLTNSINNLITSTCVMNQSSPDSPSVSDILPTVSTLEPNNFVSNSGFQTAPFYSTCGSTPAGEMSHAQEQNTNMIDPTTGLPQESDSSLLNVSLADILYNPSGSSSCISSGNNLSGPNIIPDYMEVLSACLTGNLGSGDSGGETENSEISFLANQINGSIDQSVVTDFSEHNILAQPGVAANEDCVTETGPPKVRLERKTIAVSISHVKPKPDKIHFESESGNEKRYPVEITLPLPSYCQCQNPVINKDHKELVQSYVKDQKTIIFHHVGRVVLRNVEFCSFERNNRLYLAKGQLVQAKFFTRKYESIIASCSKSFPPFVDRMLMSEVEYLKQKKLLSPSCRTSNLYSLGLVLWLLEYFSKDCETKFEELIVYKKHLGHDCDEYKELSVPTVPPRNKRKKRCENANIKEMTTCLLDLNGMIYVAEIGRIFVDKTILAAFRYSDNDQPIMFVNCHQVLAHSEGLKLSKFIELTIQFNVKLINIHERIDAHYKSLNLDNIPDDFYTSRWIEFDNLKIIFSYLMGQMDSEFQTNSFVVKVVKTRLHYVFGTILKDKAIPITYPEGTIVNVKPSVDILSLAAVAAEISKSPQKPQNSAIKLLTNNICVPEYDQTRPVSNSHKDNYDTIRKQLTKPIKTLRPGFNRSLSRSLSIRNFPEPVEDREISPRKTLSFEKNAGTVQGIPLVGNSNVSPRDAGTVQGIPFMRNSNVSPRDAGTVQGIPFIRNSNVSPRDAGTVQGIPFMRNSNVSPRDAGTVQGIPFMRNSNVSPRDAGTVQGIPFMGSSNVSPRNAGTVQDIPFMRNSNVSPRDAGTVQDIPLMGNSNVSPRNAGTAQGNSSMGNFNAMARNLTLSVISKDRVPSGTEISGINSYAVKNTLKSRLKALDGQDLLDSSLDEAGSDTSGSMQKLTNYDIKNDTCNINKSINSTPVKGAEPVVETLEYKRNEKILSSDGNVTVIANESNSDIFECVPLFSMSDVQKDEASALTNPYSPVKAARGYDQGSFSKSPLIKKNNTSATTKTLNQAILGEEMPMLDDNAVMYSPQKLGTPKSSPHAGTSSPRIKSFCQKFNQLEKETTPDTSLHFFAEIASASQDLGDCINTELTDDIRETQSLKEAALKHINRISAYIQALILTQPKIVKGRFICNVGIKRKLLEFFNKSGEPDQTKKSLIKLVKLSTLLVSRIWTISELQKRQLLSKGKTKRNQETSKTVEAEPSKTVKAKPAKTVEAEPTKPVAAEASKPVEADPNKTLVKSKYALIFDNPVFSTRFSQPQTVSAPTSKQNMFKVGCDAEKHTVTQTDKSKSTFSLPKSGEQVNTNLETDLHGLEMKTQKANESSFIHDTWIRNQTVQARGITRSPAVRDLETELAVSSILMDTTESDCDQSEISAIINVENEPTMTMSEKDSARYLAIINDIGSPKNSAAMPRKSEKSSPAPKSRNSEKKSLMNSVNKLSKLSKKNSSFRDSVKKSQVPSITLSDGPKQNTKESQTDISKCDVNDSSNSNHSKNTNDKRTKIGPGKRKRHGESRVEDDIYFETKIPKLIDTQEVSIESRLPSLIDAEVSIETKLPILIDTEVQKYNAEIQKSNTRKREVMYVVVSPKVKNKKPDCTTKLKPENDKRNNSEMLSYERVCSKGGTTLEAGNCIGEDEDNGDHYEIFESV